MEGPLLDQVQHLLFQNLNITTNFYVQATENGCSSPRTSVTATIKDMPTVDDPTSQAFVLAILQLRLILLVVMQLLLILGLIITRQ